MAAVSILSSYAPAIVNQRFANDPEPLTEPSTFSFDAAVVFVDVSGFTKLGEKLSAQYGERGSELLNDYVNGYFDSLVQETLNHGGDILKFAGDAMLVIWKPQLGAEEELPKLVLRATACCLALVQKYDNYAPTEGVSLTLHTGVGAGSLDAFYVGGTFDARVDRRKWEFFVAGEPIQQMSDACEEATSGEIMLSAAAFELLLSIDATAKGTPRPAGMVHVSECNAPAPAPIEIDVNPMMQEGLAGFVPAMVEQKTASRQSDGWLSEHRKVVTVFLKLLGLGDKTCEVAGLAPCQAAVSLVQRVVFEHGGSITRLICDDKGTRFLIAFGLAGNAHEDDEWRGVHAAMQICDGLQRDPPDGRAVQVSIGITTGRVFCGEAGCRLRREYSINGSRVNLAARLMQSKAALVLCDEPTYRAVEAGAFKVGFKGLDSLKVKGFAELVAVFEPFTEGNMSLRLASELGNSGSELLLGRDKETKRLDGILLDLAAGYGGCLLIDGFPGMGKSRLLQYLVAQCASSDAPRTGLLYSKAEAVEQKVPWSGLTGLLAPLVSSKLRQKLEAIEKLEEPTRDSTQQALEFFQESLEVHHSTVAGAETRDEELSDTRDRGSDALPAAKIMTGDASGGDPEDLDSTAAAASLKRPQRLQEALLHNLKLADITKDELIAKHLPLLSSVLPLHLPDNEATLHLKGEERNVATFKVILRLLSNLVRGVPTLLVIDNAQWMDSMSLALVHEAFRGLSAEGGALWVVLAARAADADSLASTFEKKDVTVDRLSVPPLSPEDLLQLASNKLGVSSLPTQLAELLTSKCQGNPSWAEQMALAMKDSGTLIIDADGGCRINPERPLSEVQFPDSLEKAVLSRIDQTPPQAALTLKITALTGRDFDLDSLIEMHPTATAEERQSRAAHSEALEDLRLLCKRDFVLLKDQGPPEVLYFKSQIVQDVAYNLLPFAQRTALHEQAALLYEARYAKATRRAAREALVPVLAHHWVRAEHPEKAVHYLCECGRQARKAFALSEALHFFEKAIDLCKKGGSGWNPEDARAQHAKVTLEYGKALVDFGEYEDAKQPLEESLAARGEEWPSVLDTALAVEAAYQALRHLAGGVKAVAPAKPDRSPEEQRTLEAASVMGRLCEVNRTAGALRDARYCALRAANLASRVGQSPELARAYVCIAAVITSSPALHGLFEVYEKRARAVCETLGEKGLPIRMDLIAGTDFAAHGLWDKATAALEKAKAAACELGAARHQEEAIRHLALVKHLCGQFDSSRKLFRDAELSAIEHGDDPMVAMVRAASAINEMMQLPRDVGGRDTSDADSPAPLSLPEVVASLKTIEDPPTAALALAFLRSGDRAGALAAGEACRSFMSGSKSDVEGLSVGGGHEYSTLLGHSALAELYLILWDEQRADGIRPGECLPPDEYSSVKRAAALAVSALVQTGGKFACAAPRAKAFAAWLKWLLGSTARAEAEWHECAVMAKKLNMPYEEALAAFCLGTHKREPKEREAHLTHAAELFTSMGAWWYVERCAHERANPLHALS